MWSRPTTTAMSLCTAPQARARRRPPPPRRRPRTRCSRRCTPTGSTSSKRCSRRTAPCSPLPLPTRPSSSGPSPRTTTRSSSSLQRRSRDTRSGFGTACSLPIRRISSRRRATRSPGFGTSSKAPRSSSTTATTRLSLLWHSMTRPSTADRSAAVPALRKRLQAQRLYVRIGNETKKPNEA
eukprot:Amastigsp_a508707_40.p3 type:complete len:181 gc:universal Amastigsp_a508707_40:588-1130(+)